MLGTDLTYREEREKVNNNQMPIRHPRVWCVVQFKFNSLQQ